ncbi:deoxyribodipyrimidine photolyase [Polynucleobacter wuianus]|uniref:Deoxyribodipyrimidine photolyase n=1 Tax=Polynucleobacter wuianus TaxID=1743168 RepID=A0A191UGQ8_9BURK|nr:MULTISPECIES: cryptochrome/photolyase family protein [Polynucleobacter]ANJ00185.1 deoxyribodipyrimidine photolyase [Polynucleobacter wuianus]MBU3553468.1 cryptochrome/photolyase family protein [Polynucleobacter sp. MWH-Post4-6-1]
MKPPKRLILLLGDQLDLKSAALKDFDLQADEVFMVESLDEAQYVWSHQAKIALFLSAMRHFAQSLKTLGYPITYLKNSPLSIIDALKEKLQQEKITQLVCMEPGEWRLKQQIEKLAVELKLQLDMREDKHFFCSRQEFTNWAAGKKEFRLEYFYRLMRKTHNILVDVDGNPEGGQWNFDQDNRKPFPKKGPGIIDDPVFFEPDAITQEVIAYVSKAYAKHPGSLEAFRWPVNRDQALEALNYFVEYRLRNFGTYQDAMWTDTPYGWHSILSSSLNLKLLNPREVISAVIDAWKKYSLDLSTVEGFIRQILGWREFVRGMYYLDMPKMAQDNYYEHQRTLPKWYWDGKTNMACMKDAIGQTLKYGYAHHIQRLMVTGNFALLAEVLPSAVCDWYLAIYVDAIEWVELPNTAGMALFANGGRFTSKPYIASGAYIKRMSNYCDSCKYKPEVRFGETACPVTTLYWNFLIKHRTQFEASPRTRLMTANLKRISDADQQSIVQHAQHVLTHLNDL